MHLNEHWLVLWKILQWALFWNRGKINVGKPYIHDSTILPSHDNFTEGLGHVTEVNQPLFLSTESFINWWGLCKGVVNTCLGQSASPRAVCQVGKGELLSCTEVPVDQRSRNRYQRVISYYSCNWGPHLWILMGKGS